MKRTCSYIKNNIRIEIHNDWNLFLGLDSNFSCSEKCNKIKQIKSVKANKKIKVKYNHCLPLNNWTEANSKKS